MEGQAQILRTETRQVEQVAHEPLQPAGLIEHRRSRVRDLVGDDHINDAVVELVRHSIGFGEYSYAAELIEALRDLLP